MTSLIKSQIESKSRILESNPTYIKIKNSTRITWLELLKNLPEIIKLLVEIVSLIILSLKKDDNGGNK